MLEGRAPFTLFAIEMLAKRFSSCFQNTRYSDSQKIHNMRKRVTIRKADPDDAQSIAKVHVDSWRKAYRGLVPAEQLARLDYVRGAERFHEAIVDGSEQIYVVEQSNAIVGFLALGVCRDLDVDQEVTGEVYAMYLLPAHWRQGLGQKMCCEAVQLLKESGYSRVVLWVLEGNEGARRFYEAMSFVADGERKLLRMGIPLNVLRYGKAI